MTEKSSSTSNFSTASYKQQLNAKLNLFRLSLLKFGDLPIEVHESELLGFRMRAEFRIWHENGHANYAMNHPGEKRPYIIKNFPIGSHLAKAAAAVCLARALFNTDNFITRE